MSADWVGVVGTGIGAGIGGVVTIIALWIKGRQEAALQKATAKREERHRAEDRDVSLRSQNAQERRDAYRALLDTARQMVVALDLLHSRYSADPDVAPGVSDATEVERQRVFAAMRAFVESASKIDVLAVDEAVLVLSSQLSRAVSDAFAEVTFQTNDAPSALSEVRNLSRQLTKACRVDLGYTTEN